MSERTVPAYCPYCMHWVSTHGYGPEGCLYRGCHCPAEQDVLVSMTAWKKNSNTEEPS